MATLRPLEDETFHALADELASMTQLPHVLWLIERMTAQYDELDQTNTDLLRECRERAIESGTLEGKLDDIMTMHQMVSTGFREYTDLERTIQA